MNAPKSKIGKEVLRKYQNQIKDYVKKHGTFIGFEFEVDGVKHKIIDDFDYINKAEIFIKKIKKEFDI